MSRCRPLPPPCRARWSCWSRVTWSCDRSSSPAARRTRWPISRPLTRPDGEPGSAAVTQVLYVLPGRGYVLTFAVPPGTCQRLRAGGRGHGDLVRRRHLRRPAGGRPVRHIRGPRSRDDGACPPRPPAPQSSGSGATSASTITRRSPPPSTRPTPSSPSTSSTNGSSPVPAGPPTGRGSCWGASGRSPTTLSGAARRSWSAADGRRRSSRPWPRSSGQPTSSPPATSVRSPGGATGPSARRSPPPAGAST